MAGRMNKVLIVGGTAGIGEQFVRRFHSLGKKVIATGRNGEKLESLKKELEGLETSKFDISDLKNLPGNIGGILSAHPDLDTVIITAGIQKSFNYFDPTSIAPEGIVSEITINLTAPTLLVQLVAPHLAGLAASGVKTSLLVTSSSLAYVPLGFYPTYSASKAGVHALLLALRQQLSFAPAEIQKNMCVTEIVPPYTDTGMDAEHREATIAMQGGKDKAFPAMPLNEFIDGFFKALEETGPDGALGTEVGVGFGKIGFETWRGSLGKIYEGWGMST